MIYGELGSFPIEIGVKLRMISYWEKLLTGKETNLSYFTIPSSNFYWQLVVRNLHSVYISLSSKILK
jgi:hypothetical protein